MSKVKSFLKLIKYNIILQFRQGFYYAWLFITIMYILAFYFMPEHIKKTIIPLILLSEPSTFAMLFTGAIVLFEREDQLFENLFITPLTIRAYIYSKMISIAIPATFCTLLISFLSIGFNLKILLIIPPILLTTFFFVSFAFIFAVSAKDLMSFMGRIVIYGSIFSLTILDYFGFLKGYYQYLLPSKGALVLLSSALCLESFSLFDILLSYISILGALILIQIPAEKAFYKQIILKGGN